MCFYSLACAQEERVLIICGKAVLTPSDGTDAVTISAGDFVKFHKGFSCRCVCWYYILLQQTIPSRDVCLCVCVCVYLSITYTLELILFVNVTQYKLACAGPHEEALLLLWWRWQWSKVCRCVLSQILSKYYPKSITADQDDNDRNACGTQNRIIPACNRNLDTGMWSQSENATTTKKIFE
jgi:hypothetical protein